MSKYQVVHSFGNVIHEGSRDECLIVMEAFKKYGIADHKFDLIEKAEKAKLNDDTREAIVEHLVYSLSNVMFGDGMEEDYVRDGMGFVGVNNLSDSELLEELASIGHEEHELYIKGMAELAVEAMLTEE